MAISTLLPIIYCTIVIVLSGFTMWNLTWFVSNIKSSSQNSISQPDQGVFFPMMFNAGLVVLFIAQHSFLKTNQIGSYLTRQRITSSIARSIYVILTSVTLQIIVAFWTPITSYCSVLLDLPDLIGIRQIYYFCLNLTEITDLKSTELQRLYSHKRHPSYVGILILLWVTPLMSLDRFLLALAFSLYMAVAWEPTLDDRRYHQRQLDRKHQEISYSNRRKQMQNSELRNFRG
uniref:Nuclear envelope membrane protein n=1 Tax=Daphnia galeata TaxID=27404 RepID=A0A8J2RSL9_9CRUS|nr:unnamed protein product [Daphnia galeata]